MPQIIPIRDLKDTNGISEMVKKSSEPIFVTKNGYGEMVIMSIEEYDRNFSATVIRRLLKEAEDEIESGIEPRDAKTVLGELRKKYAE